MAKARILIVVALLLWAPRAFAHEANSAGTNLAQKSVTHADVAVGAGATSHYLTTDTNRVTALCYNVGTTNVARMGDSAVAVAQGIPLPPATANQVMMVPFDVTDDVYIYSAAGTTVGCTEIVRP